MVGAEDIARADRFHVLDQARDFAADERPVAGFQDALVQSAAQHEPAFRLLGEADGIASGFHLHRVQAVESRLENQRQRLLHAAARVQEHRHAAGMEEIDDFPVIRKNQRLEHSGRAKQPVAIAQVLAHAEAVGRARFVEQDAPVGLVKIGVDTVVVVNPCGIERQAFVHAHVAHALAHQFPNEHLPGQRPASAGAPPGQRVARRFDIQTAAVDAEQQRPVVPLPRRAAGHAKIDVFRRARFALPIAQRGASAVAPHDPFLRFVQDFGRAWIGHQVDAQRRSGHVEAEMAGRIDRFALGVERIALRRPAAQRVGPDVFGQGDALGRVAGHHADHQFSRGLHRPRAPLPFARMRGASYE
ncbi:MAG: hypothetical protein BWZ10_02602 [candidate division BRC1 bacterium ADurb.BinA364]|nr:MAG: hypothetical protein BWZ10_02602 [candidate division BRC1 bacterium ADurb.BinA364]